MTNHTYKIGDKVAKDDSDCETEEDIVARLKVIANNILEGIEVEEDMPAWHDVNKLPILNMKVHLEGFII